MKYQQYVEARQEAFNKLPLFWAFSKDQFKEAMEERGLTEKDTDKLYRFGNTGAMYLKSDQPIFDKFYEDMKKQVPLSKLMEDFDFAEDAIYYEMCNHEYAINWQGKWDVCNCFTDNDLPYHGDDLYGAEELKKYFDIMGWKESTRKAWNAAYKRYMKDAELNDWF